MEMCKIQNHGIALTFEVLISTALTLKYTKQQQVLN